MDTTQQPFKKERKETDNSLLVERGKTDESFNTGRKDTHLRTDEVVTKDRVEADQDRLKLRTDADSDTSKNSDSEDSTSALENQRQSEDKAIESERLNMDKALKNERREKERLMNMLVSQEREATDKNLLGERAKTDSETEKSAELLTVEQAAHTKTKSALTTREEFVAVVSHDLRNPIGSILSFSELLLEDPLVSENNGKVKKWVEIIKRNAETSLRLISDILDMERIVEGKLQLQLTKNYIDELIQNSLDSHLHIATAKKILLKANPSRSEAILCDKDRVAQVLSNLISNALKFTPENGSVTVEARETDDEITISVKDTGPGVPDDKKLKIFERFAQLENKQRTGIGLGLYISKTLVESHAGKIWVTSQPGSGSTFWFTLPKQTSVIH